MTAQDGGNDWSDGFLVRRALEQRHEVELKERSQGTEFRGRCHDFGRVCGRKDGVGLCFVGGRKNLREETHSLMNAMLEMHVQTRFVALDFPRNGNHLELTDKSLDLRQAHIGFNLREKTRRHLAHNLIMRRVDYDNPRRLLLLLRRGPLARAKVPESDARYSKLVPHLTSSRSQRKAARKLLEYIGLRGKDGPLALLKERLITEFGPQATFKPIEELRARRHILLFARGWSRHFREYGDVSDDDDSGADGDVESNESDGDSERSDG